MLEGTISVDSTEGIGSTFTITVPYVPQKINKKETHSEKGEVQVINRKILIAEDEIISYQYLSIILDESKNTLFYAENGQEAIEVYKNNPNIEIILMDIKMPVLGGYEATEEIRKLNKDVIIIAQTAYARFGDRQKAIAAGCNDYITKPIDAAELMLMISNHLK